MGCKSITGLTPALNLLVLIHTPELREAPQELPVSVLATNKIHCPWPGLKPEPLDLEMSALIMRPSCLHSHIIMALLLKHILVTLTTSCPTMPPTIAQTGLTSAVQWLSN